MIKFGPSGNSESFFNEGYKSTVQMPKWLSERGLDIFEYSFGRGVNIGEQAAREIAAEAKKYNVELTAHAPYFVNLANPDDEKANNSFGYIIGAFKALSWFGGNRLVVHLGSEGKLKRDEAIRLIFERLNTLIKIKNDGGFQNIKLCVETMGKFAQIGDVAEICEFCNIDDCIYPCIDFGHVNSREGGSLKSSDDYRKIVDYMQNKIGSEKTNNMHVHFSKIEYSKKGEIRHLTFADTVYGPEFSDFAEVIAEKNLTPYVLSESAGTQAEDALTMKNLYLLAKNK